MWITPQEFGRIAAEVWHQHRNSPYNLSDPRVLARLVLPRLRELGVEGVCAANSTRRACSAETLERPMRLRDPLVFTDAELAANRAEARRQWAQAAGDLEALSSNPVTAGAYSSYRMAGQSNTDAMNHARTVGHVYEMLAEPLASRAGEPSE